MIDGKEPHFAGVATSWDLPAVVTQEGAIERRHYSSGSVLWRWRPVAMHRLD
jgi:hypothetical protein